MRTPRPAVDEVLLHTAFAWAGRSTCPSLSVGAVISRDGRILSTGYNGAPTGLPHCEHPARLADDPLPELERVRECRAVHAEANSLIWAARCGVRVADAQLTTTDTPCLRCAQLIIQAGLVRVVAGRRYRDAAGWDLLGDAGLELVVL